MKVSRPRVPTGAGVEATPMLQSRGGPWGGNLRVNIRWDLMLWKDLFLQREDLPAGLVLTSEPSARLAVKMWWISSALKLTQPKHHHYYYCFAWTIGIVLCNDIFSLLVATIESERTTASSCQGNNPPSNVQFWALSFWADVHAEERFPPCSTFLPPLSVHRGVVMLPISRNRFQYLLQTKRRPLRDILISKHNILNSPSLRSRLPLNLQHVPLNSLPSYINWIYLFMFSSYWSSV